MLDVKVLLTLLFFVITGWFLLTFRILDVPPGINGDEAAIGYNAALVAQTGRDQSGNFMPLFVSTFDLTDWKQPVTFYSEVLAFKIFGPSYFTFRAVSVAIILIGGIIIFAFIKEILGFKAAVVSLFIYLTIPAVVIQSHLALENIAPIPFMAGWLLAFAKYKKKYQIKYLILGAVCLGIGLFSYPGMRLVVPVMLVSSLTFIWYLYRHKSAKLFKALITFFLVFIPFPVIMLALKNVYPGAVLAYNRPHLISSYQAFFLPVLSAFDWSFLFLKGDVTVYHSTGQQGVFLLSSLPLFILGLVAILRRREPIQYLILSVFFLTPALYGLTGTASVYRSSRMLAFLPSFTFITSMGFMAVFNAKSQLKNVGLILIITIMLLNFADFVKDYWYNYPLRVKSEFAKPMQLVFAKASQLAKKEKLKPYIQDNFSAENKIARKFFEQVYFPGGITEFNISRQVPPRSVLITGNSIFSNQKGQLQKYDVGSQYFSVIVSK